jgi:hypothetical protein
VPRGLRDEIVNSVTDPRIQWNNQFTVKLTVVLPDGTVASELLTVKAFTVTV